MAFCSAGKQPSYIRRPAIFCLLCIAAANGVSAVQPAPPEAGMPCKAVTTSEEVMGLVQMAVHSYVQSGGVIDSVTGDVSSSATSDVSSNATSDVSSNATSDVSSNATSDVSSNATSDVPSKATSNVSLQVSSSGGVGTTALMLELQRSLTSPMNNFEDEDGRKHRPYPVLKKLSAFQAANVTKILFLHGDPVHAVLSMYRRGIAEHQARKFRMDGLSHGSEVVPMYRGGQAEHQARELRTSWTKPFPATVQEYSRAGSEVFGLEEHFDSFLRQCDYPIAFLKMEAKTLHLEALAEFLEADVDRLRQHLSPWVLARATEEAAVEELLAERNTTVGEELLMERVQEMLGDVQFDKGSSEEAIMDRVRSRSGALRPKRHDYKEVSKGAKERISKRFARLTGKLKKLGDFKVFEVEDCKHRHL